MQSGVVFDRRRGLDVCEGTVVTIALIAGVARELSVTAGQAVRDSAVDVLWWVAPAAIVVGAATVLEIAKSFPRENLYRRIADRATKPLVGLVLGLLVLGGWGVSHVAVSVFAVMAMILFEVCKSLPQEHRYRQLADDLTTPLVVIAIDVVLLCGWQLAEIIGFIQ
jgi:hypothetical protein